MLTLALSCVLAGCGAGKDLSGSKYLGLWKAAKTEFLGESDDADNVFDGDFTIEFKADGTAVATSFNGDTNQNEISNCTWKETGSGVKLSGDMKLTMKDVDGKLDTSVFGFHMIFVRAEEPST